jgi:hypothetical protein
MYWKQLTNGYTKQGSLTNCNNQNNISNKLKFFCFSSQKVIFLLIVITLRKIFSFNVQQHAGDKPVAKSKHIPPPSPLSEWRLVQLHTLVCKSDRRQRLL